jgi:3-hydroxybutyryl-CoA dehydrogenase
LGEPGVPRAAVTGDLVVGVVGCGTMGLGIAEVAVRSGARVIAFDVSAESRDPAAERLLDRLERHHLRAGAAADDASRRADAEWQRFTLAPALEALGVGSDLIIEAVIEDLSTKRAVFETLDDVAPGSTVLATNTSALSVARIAAATTTPERVLGLHFFNPVPAMALVEVVETPVSDAAAVARAEAIVTAWGKRTIRCQDTPGFIVNRVNRPFTLEALATLDAGDADVEGIDLAMRAAGYPMGPFELMDLIGIDVNLAVAEAIHAAARAAGDVLADRFRPSDTQRRMVAEGRLGRKTGEGFYRYAPDSSTPTGAAVGATTGALDGPAVRIVLAIILEAYRAADAGVASRADIDLALRLGARHPAGPFELAQHLGTPAELLAAALGHASGGPRFAIPAGLRADAAAGP